MILVATSQLWVICSPLERHVRQRNRSEMEFLPVFEGIERSIEFLNGLLAHHAGID